MIRLMFLNVKVKLFQSFPKVRKGTLSFSVSSFSLENVCCLQQNENVVSKTWSGDSSNFFGLFLFVIFSMVVHDVVDPTWENCFKRTEKERRVPVGTSSRFGVLSLGFFYENKRKRQRFLFVRSSGLMSDRCRESYHGFSRKREKGRSILT